MFGSNKFKHDEERLESRCKQNKVDYQPPLSDESNDDTNKRRMVLNANIKRKRDALRMKAKRNEEEDEERVARLREDANKKKTKRDEEDDEERVAPVNHISNIFRYPESLFSVFLHGVSGLSMFYLVFIVAGNPLALDIEHCF